MVATLAALLPLVRGTGPRMPEDHADRCCRHCNWLALLMQHGIVLLTDVLVEYIESWLIPPLKTRTRIDPLLAAAHGKELLDRIARRITPDNATGGTPRFLRAGTAASSLHNANGLGQGTAPAGAAAHGYYRPKNREQSLDPNENFCPSREESGC